MDGVEVRQRLRAHPATPQIPIILIAARNRLMLMGASLRVIGQLPKPFDVYRYLPHHTHPTEIALAGIRIAECVHRRLRRRRGLAALSDQALYALLARIETILLDCPHSGCHLAVEVVHEHEARLLATYRTLPEERRWEVLALAERYLATSRAHRDTRQRADAYQGQRARASRAG
jgi:CheY-like chemotaxis protein